MLWLPDIVAGAVNAGVGVQSRWRVSISDSIEEVTVTLT